MIEALGSVFGGWFPYIMLAFFAIFLILTILDYVFRRERFKKIRHVVKVASIAVVVFWVVYILLWGAFMGIGGNFRKGEPDRYPIDKISYDEFLGDEDYTMTLTLEDGSQTLKSVDSVELFTTNEEYTDATLLVYNTYGYNKKYIAYLPEDIFAAMEQLKELNS